jgi:hypothetical protein
MSKSEAATLWLPDTHLSLRQGMGMLGRNEIPEWNGSEEAARLVSDPPDPPWMWELPDDSPQGYFKFIDNDEILEVEETEAQLWWQGIEPILQAEWKAELSARERWLACAIHLRNLFAKGEVTAMILSNSGHPPSE